MHQDVLSKQWWLAKLNVTLICLLTLASHVPPHPSYMALHLCGWSMVQLSQISLDLHILPTILVL